MCYVLEDVRGLRCRSRVLIIGVMAAGVALGIGFGAVLNLHFLRKRWFLSVVLPDPSTLIQYWRFGRTVMTFPPVFHWWFSGLCMATVLRVCNGGDCGCVYCTFLLFCCFGVRGVHRGIEQLLPIRGVACSRLAVKGWNHRVCGEVRAAPMIGQYLGLGCFGMAWTTLSLSKEPWGPVFPFTILFVIFTVSSARPLNRGYATEDSLCLTHHVWRNSWNTLEMKGGPPSVLSSSGVLYVWNRCRQMGINLDVVAWAGFRWYKMSQPVSLSAQARYTTWPTWNMSITICWNGHSGAGVMMMGSRGWLGAIVVQIGQFALKLWMDAFIWGQ